MTAQKSLFEHFGRKDLQRRYGRNVHGGLQKKPGRKLERPLAPGKPHHLILKSSKAKGTWSFLRPRHQQLVREILRAKAAKFGVKIADFANVGTHLHLTVRFSRRESFQNFLRSVTTLIARRITGARRGHPIGKFWEGLAYTRAVRNPYDEFQLKDYFEANRIEARLGKAAREKFLESKRKPTRAPSPA